MPETTHELLQVTYLRWIVLLPLIGAIINGLGGALIQKAAGKRAISVIACVLAVGCGGSRPGPTQTPTPTPQTPTALCGTEPGSSRH